MKTLKHTLQNGVELSAHSRPDGIRFVGAVTGEHWLHQSSSRARIWAHWQGYCLSAERHLDRNTSN
mgnify:CR=1 FL=1